VFDDPALGQYLELVQVLALATSTLYPNISFAQPISLPV
jgi:hypothetical protein